MVRCEARRAEEVPLGCGAELESQPSHPPHQARQDGRSDLDAHPRQGLAQRKARKEAQRRGDAPAPVGEGCTFLYINGVLRGRKPLSGLLGTFGPCQKYLASGDAKRPRPFGRVCQAKPAVPPGTKPPRPSAWRKENGVWNAPEGRSPSPLAPAGKTARPPGGQTMFCQNRRISSGKAPFCLQIVHSTYMISS